MPDGERTAGVVTAGGPLKAHLARLGRTGRAL